MDTQDILFKVAVKDLKAAKSLYSQKLYAQAVFSMQQSVEKATKSFGLLLKMTTPTDLQKNVGHKTSKMYLKGMEEYSETMTELQTISANYPQIMTTGVLSKFDFDNFAQKTNQDLNTFKSLKPHSFFNLRLREIENILAQLEECQKGFDKFVEHMDRLDKEILFKAYDQIIDTLKAFNTPETDLACEEINQMLGDEEQVEMLMQSMKLYQKMMGVLMPLFMNLYCLGLLFDPHATKTRYPYEDTQSNPLEIYHARMPLIKKLPELMNVLEKSLKTMKNLNKDFNLN